MIGSDMMSNSVSCFDIVRMTVETASTEFAPDFTLNHEAFAILEQYCSIVDDMVAHIEAESIEAVIDPIMMTVVITLTSADCTLYRDNLRFFQLIKRSKSMCFAADEHGENLKVSFEFPSVWNRAN